MVTALVAPMVNLTSAVAAPGDITTIVGGGTTGLGDGGPATSAMLALPWGLARSGGDLYISDSLTQPPYIPSAAPIGNRLRRVDASGAITTMVGGVTPPRGDGGPATEASFTTRIADLAFDSAGNLYIADGSDHRVRRVDAVTGVITTYAGNGGAGSTGDGLLATDAEIGFPVFLAVDAAGNLYIPDGNRVRKVDAATHIITTVAGGGTPADGLGDGGQATAAALSYPRGIAIGPDGNLYISDTGHSRIRKVDLATGTITTVAGNGGSDPAVEGAIATETTAPSPQGITVDPAGNIYFVSYAYAGVPIYRVYKVDAVTDIITTVAGGGSPADGLGDGLPGPQARFDFAIDVAVNAVGDVFITDLQHYRVRRVDHATGIISTYAGTGIEGFNGNGLPAAQTQLDRPIALGTDPAGNLYLSEDFNKLVRRIDATTTIVTTVAGGGVGDGLPGTQASLNNPRGLATDADGNILIADCGDHRVRKYNVTTGIVTTVAGGGQPVGAVGDGLQATKAELLCPTALFVVPPGTAIPAGTLFIADAGQNRVRRVAPNGIITTVAGTGVAGFNGNGKAATRAQLSNPSGVTVDAAGNIYISDTDNHRVRKVDAVTGIISTVAGNGKIGLGGSGVAATSTPVTGPLGLLLDGSGNLLIADAGFPRIRSLNLASGIITTVAGTGIPAFGGDGGPAIDATLDQPTEMIFDAAGNLDFTDRANHRVRQIQAGTPAPPPTVGCGSVITANTTLTADVGPCPGDGIIIGADNVTLNLAGHKVTGGGPGDGTHAGVTIRNHSGVRVTGNARAGGPRGIVSFFDAGVVVIGGSANTVTNLITRNNHGPSSDSLYGDGVVVFFSARNQITNNVLVNNGPFDGVGLLGFGTDANTVSGNDVENTKSGGDESGAGVGVGIIVNPFFSFDLPRGVSVYDNRIIANTVSHNDNGGISSLSNIGGVIRGNTVEQNGLLGCDFCAAPGNGIGVQALQQAEPVTRTLVSYNQVHGNGLDGIEVRSEGNQILNNVATANRFQDLSDSHPDCDANTWSGNTYVIAFPDCTTAGGHQVAAPASAPSVANATPAPLDPPAPVNRRVPPR